MPGLLSQLRVQLQLRSWSHHLWVRTPCQTLCWQLRIWSLLQILCLPLSLPFTHSNSLSLSLSLKDEYTDMIEHQDLTFTWGTGQNLLKRKYLFFGPRSTLILPLNNPPYSRKLFLNKACSWEYFFTGYYLVLEFKNSFGILFLFLLFLQWLWRKEAELMWTADLQICGFSFHMSTHQLPVVICAEIRLLKNREWPILIKPNSNV